MKKRYSDFLVHEVDENGKIAILDSLEEELLEKKECKQEEFSTAEEKLSKLVGKSEASIVMNLLNNPCAEKKNHVLPIAPKEKRKEIHLLIRSPDFSNMAVGDTVDGCVRIWSKQFQKESGSYKSKSNSNWKNENNFLQFVLYKENIDTSTACQDVCRFLKLSFKTRVGFAGMKDKRGITSQFCTIYRKSPSDLQIINKSEVRSGGLIRVGNFSYKKDSLQLGKLSGNRFDIVLRNVDVSNDGDLKASKARMEEAANTFREYGFINYFGTQRFGKYSDTHLVGLAALKLDFERAVELIMRPKADEHERYLKPREIWKNRFDNIDMHDEEAMQAAEKKSAKEIISKFKRFMICEGAILNSLSKKPRNYRSAFSSIPKNTKLMFAHAVQSLLFNKMATFRILNFTESTQVPIIGDLVLVENKSKDEGGSGTSGRIGKAVEVVNESNIQDYSITDVVLPLIGTKVQLPKYKDGKGALLAHDLLQKEGLTMDDFLQTSNKELSLGGDYRKLICKPTDVDYQIKIYHDPIQPLVLTDLMRIQGVALTEDDANKNEKEENLVGMVISFTLPTSSYATIAIRELMKMPTCSQFQKHLTMHSLQGEKLNEQTKKQKQGIDACTTVETNKTLVPIDKVRKGEILEKENECIKKAKTTVN